MLMKISIEGNENDMLNEIKSKLTENEYYEIMAEINSYCESCEMDKAISLISLYGENWEGTKMQLIHEMCDKDEVKAKLYAGVILKEAILQNKKYVFECVNAKGRNCYYKRKEE